MIIVIDKLDYKGKYRLDISFATGDPFYCPGWQMFMDYKNKIINEKTFKRLYINLMKNRFNNPFMKWKIKGLLKKEKIVLCAGKNDVHQNWLEEIIKQEINKRRFNVANY